MFKNYKPYSTRILSTALIARDGEGEGAGNTGGSNDDSAAREAAARAATAAAEAEVQRRIDAAVENATKGLKDKNTELLGSQRALKDKLKDFDGLDAAKARKLISDAENDEDVKLFNEGKKDVVIQKYTERMRGEFQTQLESEREARKAAEGVANAFRGQVLDNQIRSVATALHPGAVEDALLHSRQIFQLDAKGNAVALDSEGRPKMGKDGVSPLTPAEWMEGMKASKPHWFPMNTSGSGSSNAREGNGEAKTIKRAEFERKSPVEQATIARSGTRIVD